MGSWSDLVPDLLVEVAVKVKQIEDFKALRGVCTSWRSAAAKDIFKGSKIPLLMLSENKKDSSSDEREFYSLLRKKIYKAAVPEAKGKRCTDARFGWVVAAAPSGGELYLFKPFSSSSPTIPLPNLHTFLRGMSFRYDIEAKFVQKAILTANPSHTSDFMLFALMDSDLAFWRNGDKNWTLIRCNSLPTGGFKNIGFCGHKMYGIDSCQFLYSWDPSAPDLTSLIIVTTLDDFLKCESVTPYIVESSGGELLIITRNNVRGGRYKTTGATRFKVARIDAVTGHWEVVSGGIGRDAVFIGENASVSVAADGAVKPNCIYFTDDCVRGYQDSEGGKDMGIYDIEQGTIERFPIQSFSPLSPPFWVFP